MGYPKYCTTCNRPAEPKSFYCLLCELAGVTRYAKKPIQTLPPEPTPPPEAPYLGRQIRKGIESLEASRGQFYQSDVAKRVGIDSSIISLWAQDKRPVPWNRIAALAEALETTEDALLGNYPRPAFLRPLRVVAGGSENPEPAFVPIVEEPEPLPPMSSEPAPSTITQWLWCESDHGSGVPRRHHHGIAPAWRLGPPERIDAA
jgi:transcriptional regulator with XRE-family HTH domain